MRTFILISLIACTNGNDGAKGPRGAQGYQGPPGPTAYRWVDATGAEVSSGPELVHFDANGYVWFLSPEDGQPEEVPAVGSYFESRDCTGPAWVLPGQPPRWPFRVAWFGGVEDAYYIRGDTQAAQEVCLGSEVSATGSTCGVVDVCLEALAVDDMTRDDEMGPPVLPWVGPLRMAL